MTPAPESAAPQVLVASADPDVAEFLVALLGSEGIVSVPSGADTAASAVSDAEPAFELVLVDTDPRTVRSIRSLADQERGRVRIVVLGADDLEPDETEDATATATGAGADAWVGRPVDDTDLLATIRDSLDGT